MHDTLGIVERSVQVLPVISPEKVVLNAVHVPVVRRATQGLDHLV